MPLQSRTFAGDAALEAALVKDSAHILRGHRGNHVAKIQSVLIFLDDAKIDAFELKNKTYGPSTAAAVLAYKRARKIINKSYQSTADDIVGKMTIKALDDELLSRQVPHGPPGGSGQCNVIAPVTPPLRFG